MLSAAAAAAAAATATIDFLFVWAIFSFSGVSPSRLGWLRQVNFLQDL